MFLVVTNPALDETVFLGWFVSTLEIGYALRYWALWRIRNEASMGWVMGRGDGGHLLDQILTKEMWMILWSPSVRKISSSLALCSGGDLDCRPGPASRRQSHNPKKGRNLKGLGHKGRLALVLFLLSLKAIAVDLRIFLAFWCHISAYDFGMLFGGSDYEHRHWSQHVGVLCSSSAT